MSFETAPAVSEGGEWLISSAYLIFQPINARCLQRLPLAKYLAVAVMSWGVTCMATAACRNFASLMAVRFLLGVFESTTQPAFFLITAQWYKKSEQPIRHMFWFQGYAFGQILAGILGYGFGHIQSPSVPQWGWFFIIFGVITTVFGFVLWYYLPDTPMNARWLSENDRVLAIERVRENRTGIANDHWKWYQFREALLDPATWFIFSVSFLGNVPSGGIGTYGNIIISGFGNTPIYTTLLQMPPGAIQFFTLIIGSFVCSYFKNKRLLVMSRKLCSVRRTSGDCED